MRACIILDLDGTIAPTEHVIFETWRRFLAPHGFVLSAKKFAESIGRVEWVEEAFDPWKQAEAMGLGTKDEVRPGVRAIQQELLAVMEPNPGVRALIEAALAHGIPLGVASSSDSAWVEERLEQFGWRGHFASVRTRDDGPGKPSPRLFEMVLEDCGADPGGSWGVEDSGPGVTAAKAAGLNVIAVPHELTATHDVSAADMILRSLDELVFDALGLTPQPQGREL